MVRLKGIYAIEQVQDETTFQFIMVRLKGDAGCQHRGGYIDFNSLWFD